VLGVRFGGEVVFFLVRRFRKVVEEECVTLMSYYPKIVFRGFGEGGVEGKRDGEGLVRRLSAGSLSSKEV
jgi:hypothetical protein